MLLHLLNPCTPREHKRTSDRFSLYSGGKLCSSFPFLQPLLVFVNVKSGGCQGLELITSFRKQLNPYQVYDLENGGPLPG